MEKIMELSEEQKNYAIDLMTSLVVEEICNESGADATKTLKEFVASETGKLLYEEESKLWWRGPSDIVAMYKKEMEEGKNKLK